MPETGKLFVMKQRDLSTFCANPWVHIHQQTWNEIFPCCVAKNPVAKLGDGLGLNDCSNSDAYKKLRLQLLNGEKPETCDFCFRAEGHGLKSIRQGVNEKYRHLISSIVESTEDDGSIKPNILSADIRIGNLCNFKCRMCSPVFSRLLEQEWKELSIPHPLEADTTPDKDEDWIQFFEANPQMNHFRFAGGEPFLTPRVLWILDYLVKSKRAERTSIDFHTNLSVLPDSFQKLFRQFDYMNILVSLEGFEKVNSYIRFPSNWERMKENLQKLDSWAEQRHLGASICTTVQAYNILNLDQLLRFTLELKNFHLPFLNLIEDPLEFQVQVLPVELRKVAERRLLSFLPQLRSANFSVQEKDRLEKAIGRIIKEMYSRELPELLPKFISRTRAHDGYRKQLVTDFLPDLAPLFSVS